VKVIIWLGVASSSAQRVLFPEKASG